MERYIENMKEIFKTAEEWATSEKDKHFKSLKEGAIEFVNENFIKELVSCTTWEEAEDIASRYII